jgi:hypothetical protein
MEFIKVRLFFFLKIFSLILLFTIIFFILNKNVRNHLFPFFNTRCLEYKQKDFSRKLNDRIVDYSTEAKRNGINVCRNYRDLKKRISDGKLVRVRSGNRYIVDRMTYSSPYVTNDSKILLDERSDVG